MRKELKSRKREEILSTTSLTAKVQIIHYDGDGRKERTERGTFRCGILKDGERVDQVKRTKEEIRKEMEERIMKEEKDVDKIL